ncbi:MBL fold metallo-hydrolase [Streptococcus gallolyticus]|uniref:MBL fold metallo-hydrolase n=1 Tax=Streptococcus gallolyticus TaxID=315405 RepID=A0A368UFL9_9STRE|nr:MBL fold metallo-hydrolase [Streptococcus gallolyticus]RCW17769.1 MBL fold metallo-hydrolase [Streptococcus gallolyticus]
MIRFSKDGQAMPEKTVPISQKAFEKIDHTDVYWLGNASILINSRGTIIVIDPILDHFDMPLLIDLPIASTDIPQVDALLISHIDNDHLSFGTLGNIKAVTKSFHAPAYVSDVMKKEGFETQEHAVGESFAIEDIIITTTPTRHNWQNESPKYQYRQWQEDEYVGYWIETPDGTIWLPSDSQLLPEHLTMPQPDMILFDFSDNDWHITYEGAIKEANTYPKADLLCIHWGSIDAASWSTFNGNPNDLMRDVVNPKRVHALDVGAKLRLTKK